MHGPAPLLFSHTLPADGADCLSARARVGDGGHGVFLAEGGVDGEPERLDNLTHFCLALPKQGVSRPGGLDGKKLCLRAGGWSPDGHAQREPMPLVLALMAPVQLAR